MAAWEASEGDAFPSIPQLRKIAALFKRPLAVFFMAEPPKTFEVMRDLRRLPGTGMRHFSPTLQIEIRLANERRQLALELASDIGEDHPDFNLTAAITDNPEQVGKKIRDALGVTPQLQLSWKDADGRASFNAWRSRIEIAGALVFQTTSFPSEEASGFAIWAKTFPVIAVNRKDAITRRTFSLVHEFAHLMLRVSGVSDLETDESRPPEDQRIEIFCNSVAAAALIPQESLLSEESVLQHGEKSAGWKDAEITDLSRKFGVSREAILRRLLTFNKTTKEFYALKRAQYNLEFHALRRRQKEEALKKDIKRNMPQETVGNFGRPFIRMLLGSYYQDQITLSEVSGFLNLKVKHLSKLEQVAGLT